LGERSAGARGEESVEGEISRCERRELKFVLGERRPSISFGGER
jgi:hypothetical protein